MFRLFIFIFMFACVCFSQPNNVIKQSDQTEGEEVIQKSRQAMGLVNNGEISSYYYKFKITGLLKNNINRESFEEISLILPGKIQAIYGSDSPFFHRSIRTWSDEKYKSILERESLSGQRTIKDITAEENKPLSKAVSDVLGKKTATAIQNSQRVNPKDIIIESLWTSIFPLTFSHPFEKKIEFKYVGKAKSNNKTANVVDVKSANGKTYRLLFDSETNYLMMMIVSEKVKNEMFVGDVETKYYFSERELINGVLIPKKIKVETKSTPEGKEPIIKFSTIEVLDFKLDPQLNEKIFSIK